MFWLNSSPRCSVIGTVELSEFEIFSLVHMVHLYVYSCFAISEFQ